VIDLAYIQKAEGTGEFLSEATYTFWHGCNQMGIATLPFYPSEIDTLPLRKETLVNGGIGMVRKALTRLGVPQPRLDGLPPAQIAEFYGRRMWATTMAEARQNYEDNKHFFIKPLKLHKEFSGHVTSGQVGTLMLTSSLPDDFEILASEVIRFEVEYRLFVYKRRIIGSRFYRGDFRKSIDYSVAEKCVELFDTSPVAYSLDMGRTPDGFTRVVEVNDAFSLGSYGMSSVPYARMVVDRWQEMVGLGW
jgi:hypothetical protein